MKVGKQFNTLTYGEYLHLIENHEKFTDFNTLGLFRSIVETTKLSLEQRLELRQVAIAAFAKTFDFLQLKDPVTYFKINALGQHLTVADERQAWEDIRYTQQRLLEGKRLRHRNFGTHARHFCGIDTCPVKGVMLKQNSPSSGSMHFHTDKNRCHAGLKSQARKQDRKAEDRIVARRIAEE